MKYTKQFGRFQHGLKVIERGLATIANQQMRIIGNRIYAATRIRPVVQSPLKQQTIVVVGHIALVNRINIALEKSSCKFFTWQLWHKPLLGSAA